MHQKLGQNPTYTKKLSKIRSRTVEPVIGTLVNFTSRRRVNTRGIENANKHVLMASLTYNLKKYMRFVRKNPDSMAQAVDQVQGQAVSALKSPLYGLYTWLVSPSTVRLHGLT